MEAELQITEEKIMLIIRRTAGVLGKVSQIMI